MANFNRDIKRAACAWCRHRREACRVDCPVAPFFPVENQTDFQNVQKLYGYYYITRLLESIPSHLRSDAMLSIIYEANAHARYPGGCLHILSTLSRQLDTVSFALAVFEQLLDEIRHSQIDRPNLSTENQPDGDDGVESLTRQLQDPPNRTIQENQETADLLPKD